MSFTSGQKHQIAHALCYPGSIIQVGSVNYNSVFNDRITGCTAETEATAIAILAKIDAIELKLESSPTKSNVKRIDDIELDTSMSDRLINKESQRLRNRLSQLLDIPNNCKGSSCMVGVTI